MNDEKAEGVSICNHGQSDLGLVLAFQTRMTSV